MTNGIKNVYSVWVFGLAINYICLCYKDGSVSPITL